MPTPTATTSPAAAGARRKSVMTRAAVCAALLLGLASFGAQAQPRHGPHNGPYNRPPPQMQHRPPQMQPRPPQARPAPPPPAYYGQAQRSWRGAGPDHRWHQGDRLPPVYRSRYYVVNDWHRHSLHAPPRGYHWVQYGTDYLLVAIATGVIAGLILSN